MMLYGYSMADTATTSADVALVASYVDRHVALTSANAASVDRIASMSDVTLDGPTDGAATRNGRAICGATSAPTPKARWRDWTGTSACDPHKRMMNELPPGRNETQTVNEGTHLSSLRNHLSSLGNHLSLLGNHISALGNHLSSLRNHLSSLGNHLSSLGNHLSSLGNHLSSLGNHLSSLGNHLSSLGNHLSSLGNHPSSLGNHPSSLDNHLSSLGNHLSSLGNHLSSLGNHPRSRRSPPATQLIRRAYFLLTYELECPHVATRIFSTTIPVK